MKFTGILTLTLALAASIAVSACGSSDDGDSRDAPTKAEFIAQADAVCTKGDKEIETLIEEKFGNKQPTQEEAVAFTRDAVVPKIQEQFDGIDELTPPEGDEETISELIDDLEAALDEIEQDPAVVLGGDSNPLADANARAQEYGFTSCGNDS